MKFLNRENVFVFAAVSLAAALSAPIQCWAQASFQGLGDLPGGGYHSYASGVSADGNTVVGVSVSSLGTEAFRWTPGGGMVGLGDLPGGSFLSSPSGVSTNGNTVVGTSRSVFGNEAFIWTPSGGMVGLGDLPGGSFSSFSSGVSSDGNTVFGGSRSAFGNEAFIWNPGGMVGLGDLPGGSFSSEATSVSADGNTVVGASVSSLGTEAFRWSLGSGMQGLGDLSGGGYYSYASGVSADGNTVVGDSGTSLGIEPFRWTPGGGMQGLGDLPGGSFYIYSTGVSADGNTVVGQSESSLGIEPFRWTPGGGMQGLGDLPGGAYYSILSGVSADGNTVVGQGESTLGTEPFIWDATNEMRSLKLVLESDYGLNLGGWRLFQAIDISDDGRVIVGYGLNPDGYAEAWRAELGPSNHGPTVSGPVSATEECISGGAYFTVEAEVFDADGEDVNVEWHVTYPDGGTNTFYDIVTFGNPPSPVTIQLNGGPHFFPVGDSSVSICVSDGIAENECGSPITISVLDTASPIILSLMERVEVGNDPGENFATVDLTSEDYAPVFSDECCPGVNGINDAPATFPIGETPVNWTVSDCYGNSLEVTQTVVVSDVEAPTATAPPDVEIGHDYGQSAATSVDLGTPVTDDNVGVTNITNNAPATFYLGETEVQWFISDAAGNTIIVTQYVTVINEDPVAAAALEQLTDIGAQAVLQLDASGSSDADHPTEDLTFYWLIENTETNAVTVRSGAVIEELFDYGEYSVILFVSDPAGGVGQIEKSVSLNPAALTSFNLECVKVLWLGSQSRAIVSGEIGTPSGVDYSELFPMAVIYSNLAGSNIAGMNPVICDVNGSNGHRWRFHDHNIDEGVHLFAVNWTGARYNFKDHGFPVRIQSEVITSSETILTLRLNRRQIDGPFTIDFDGQATVDFDDDGNVLESTVEFDEEDPGKLVTVTLPFPLVNTSSITFSGGVIRVLDVGCDLRESIGRFMMEVRFDGNAFPDGKYTVPRTLDFEIYVGMEGYSGTASLGPSDIDVRSHLWSAR